MNARKINCKVLKNVLITALNQNSVIPGKQEDKESDFFYIFKWKDNKNVKKEENVKEIIF